MELDSSAAQWCCPFSTWRFFSREQAESECDWVMMSSVFVVSQSGCFFLCSREQTRLVENRLKGEKGVASQLLMTVMVIGSIQQLLLCSQQGNCFVFFHKITVQLEKVFRTAASRP